MLWDAAGVDFPIGNTAVGLDAATIDAAVTLMRVSLMLRRLVDLMLLLVLFVLVLLLGMLLLLRGLLMLLLWGLPLLRFGLRFTLFLVLCVGWGSSSEQQEQNCHADNAGSFHLSAPPLTASSPLMLNPSSMVRRTRGDQCHEQDGSQSHCSSGPLDQRFMIRALWWDSDSPDSML